MSDKLSRRSFVQTGTAAVVAASAAKVVGANERIRVGFIGTGNRGDQLLRPTLKEKDAEVVAVCDVYDRYLERAAERVGGDVLQTKDFRRLIERDDIDALFIATPDHWHAIQTVQACDAGKDVYVEKPLSITIYEGRRMVEAARRNKRIAQVGTHRRSSTMLPKLVGLISDGTVGKVTVARCYRISNMAPDGIGQAPDSPPPKGLDWDLWLGPRPERPFNKNIAPYKFRWWSAYSSQIGNWGVHYFDEIRWLLDEEAPLSISAHGGRFAVDDARDIPDTMEAIFEFKSGRLMVFGQYETSSNPALRTGEAELRGTIGTVYVGTEANGYEIIPERGGQFEKPEPRMEPMKVKSTDGDLTRRHIRNFLDCVKSRKKPNADIEIGHRSTTFSHLGNIALSTESRIEWDPVNERITNHRSANDLLHYRYREPWKLG